MKQPLTTLHQLYSDAKSSAELVGLTYYTDELPGFSRQKRGKGFSYLDDSGNTIADNTTKKRLSALAIPPAWKDVWICPDANGHLLATGMDDRGRKQYIYHPKWREARDLLKFYRMITFARNLPGIRRSIDQNLQLPRLSRKRIIAALLWFLDNTYIRVGNDVYFSDNESLGLTTLLDQNVVIDGPVVTFSFRGKSGKEHTISIENSQIAEVIRLARDVPGNRLFQYQDKSGLSHSVSASDINDYLHDLTGEMITAKDFRTWGGTLLAFDHLILQQSSDKKTEKIIVEALDTAASVLGNTRAVARASYVHPDILHIYGSKNFTKYHNLAKKHRSVPGLDRRETELLYFLEVLFREEFELLKNK